MRIVQADKLIQINDYFYKPHERYIVSDYELDLLLRGAPRTKWAWSAFNSWERRYAGQDLNGKSVIIYRHNAWGDQLIASAVPRYLKTLYPDATIHMYCHPQVMSLWDGNPFVEGTAIPLPIPFESAIRYDYQIFFEGMLEGNSEHDQHCCYDDFFGVIGLHDVPDEFKRPYFQAAPGDYTFFNSVKAKYGERPYMLYHMSPANANRRYPPKQSQLFIAAFLDAFKDMGVIIVGQDPEEEYGELLSVFDKHSRVINLIDATPSFRDVFPIIEAAKVLVCPDSAIMHMAATMPHVPVVSLWGIFDPQDRIKYYPNTHPIFPKSVCPHAACRDHNFELPVQNCRDAEGSGKIKHCRVLEAISPEIIVATCAHAMVRERSKK